ncbi:MAG: carboxypeptidase-like regulatory domain-containing protein [Thermoanaerobaculia bacterium]
MWLDPGKETPVERASWKIVGEGPATRIELGLDCGVLPRTVRILSPTQASVPLVLESALCATPRPSETDVDLLPIAWVAGRCRLPGTSAAGVAGAAAAAAGSRAAALRVRRCAERGSRADAAFLLPVRLNGGGEWKAAVVAGCADLSYEEKGFVRETWYNLDLAKQQTKQLEERTLRASASLSGVAITPDGAPAGPDSYAFLIPPQWVPSSFGDLLSRRFPSRRLVDQRLGRKGEFEFTDLPPGTYTVIVAAGRSDLALHLSEDVEIHGGQTTRLPAIALQFGAAVEVVVDSASAPSTPDSRLLVSLVPPGSCLKASPPVGEVEMVPGVPARFFGLASGDWQIELFEQSAGAMSRLDSKTSKLRPGDEVAVEFTLEGEVFSGIVESKDEHLEELVLSFRSSFPSRGSADSRTPPQARLSANGEFSVRLPRPGEYSIQVDAPTDPGRNALVDDVLFESAREKVKIRLPSSSIAGLVVDADDRPVEGAIVDATRPASATEGEGKVRPHAFRSSKSGADGRFELHGLGQGEWHLVAHRDRERSNESSVALGREASIDDVRLMLRENRKVRGRLVQSGGIPMAGVHGYLIDASDISLSVDRFSTDSEGAFEIDRPVSQEGAPPVKLIVISGSRFAAATAWNPERDDTVDVPLPAGLLTFPATLAGRKVSAANLVLRNDTGGIVPMSLLSALEGWSGGGAVVETIGLAQGNWTLLEVDESRELEPFLRGQVPGKVVGHVLANEAGIRFVD